MPAEPAVTVRSRDHAIDFVRGAGILMIGIDHLEFLCARLAGDDFFNPFVTWLRLGWSGAAEFFVFFSGYLTGIVYLKTLQTHGVGMTCARAAQRAWHIYVLNLLSLCAVLILLQIPVLSSSTVTATTRLDLLMGAQAGEAITGFLGLRFAPLYFEILNLYIVLLLLAPAIVLLARRSLPLAVTLSFALWLLVQLNAAYGIAPIVAERSNFNPLAWQFMFVLGMASGIGGVFRELRKRWSREQLLIVTGSLLALALVVKMLDKSGWSIPLIGPIDMSGYDKPNLGWLQLSHFVVSVIFVMQIVPDSEAARQWMPVRAVAGVGRRSLECFCMSTILVYVFAAVLARNSAFDPVSLWLTGALIVVGLCLFAPLVDWIEAKPWGKPRPVVREEKTGKPDLPAAVRRVV